MDTENPYSSPNSERSANVVEAATLPRLTSRQNVWLGQTQYALKALYVTTAILTLLYFVQLVFFFTTTESGLPFPSSLWQHWQFAVTNSTRILLGAWVAVALRRFDRALSQVRHHDGAAATVLRALRMSRNAWIAMAASLLLSLAVGSLYGIWVAASASGWL